MPNPIHRAVAYSLGFRQGPAAPVRHAFGFGFQSRGNQCVSLLLIILGLASPAGLNLPERTDPGGAHALAPQGSGMAIDVIVGSNFQSPLVSLAADDLEQVVRWEAAPSTPQQVALRCRLVLAAAAGKQDLEIASIYDVNRHTAALWRQRVRAAGIGSLWEIQPGRGRKPKY